MTVRIGSLFAGVGGLDLAVESHFDGKVVWHAETSEAPSAVLAARWPGVSNLGDVTAIDWSRAPHVDVLCGGFPCQDVSTAGMRRGLAPGTRSGLWSEFAQAIDALRPEWVVIENVRGLLSAAASGDVEPCPWCLGDHGEQPALRALGAVLGDLADLGFDAEWAGIRASDVGAPHGRLRVFILAWPRERAAAHSERGGRDRRSVEQRRAPDDSAGDDLGNGANLTLLPTPDAYSADRGGSQHPDKRRAGGHTVSLADVTEQALMPTPRASRGGSATETMYKLGAERVDDERSQGQVVGDVTGWGPYEAAIHRWEAVTGHPAPSPVRHDGKGGKPRLNPELTEWMMGWPAGWVTDPAIGLSRAEQLKACGNGVVPQQAFAALRILHSRVGGRHAA